MCLLQCENPVSKTFIGVPTPVFYDVPLEYTDASQHHHLSGAQTDVIFSLSFRFDFHNNLMR